MKADPVVSSMRCEGWLTSLGFAPRIKKIMKTIITELHNNYLQGNLQLIPDILSVVR